MHTPLADDATAPDSDELAIDIPYYSSGDDEADDDGAPSTPPAAAAAAAADTNTNTDDTTDDDDPADAPPPPPPVLVCRSGLDPDYAVERWHWSALGVEAFRRRCAERRCPLIVTGLAPHLAPRGLGVERLRTLLPAEMAVPVRGHGTMSAGSFFERLDAGEKLYLADVPVAHHFPWLFAEVGVPAYFLHCFCHRTRRRLSVMHDTPALFVGGVGTTSALHVDQMRSNFWMFLAEGSKRWSCFHPDDAPLLSPTFDEPEQIDRFPPLATLEAEPATAERLARARRVDFELRAGEVLYIPHDTPHEVANVGGAPTVAVSANYLDQANVALALEQGAAKLARRDAASARHANLAQTIEALGEIEWPPLDDDLEPRGGAAEGARGGAAMVGRFAAHERLQHSRPVVIRAPDEKGAPA